MQKATTAQLSCHEVYIAGIGIPMPHGGEQHFQPPSYLVVRRGQAGGGPLSIYVGGIKQLVHILEGNSASVDSSRLVDLLRSHPYCNTTWWL